MSKFTLSECKSIIDLSLTHDKKDVKELVDHEHISYNYNLVYRTENTQWIFDRFKQYLSKRYPNNNLDKKEHFNLHKYVKGDEFAPHIDAARNPDQCLVSGCVLNDEFTGGEFIYYDPYEIYNQQPGSLYHFSTLRPHEVKMITGGVRWTMLMFITPEELGIKQSII